MGHACPLSTPWNSPEQALLDKLTLTRLSSHSQPSPSLLVYRRRRPSLPLAVECYCSGNRFWLLFLVPNLLIDLWKLFWVPIFLVPDFDFCFCFMIWKSIWFMINRFWFLNLWIVLIINFGSWLTGFCNWFWHRGKLVVLTGSVLSSHVL